MRNVALKPDGDSGAANKPIKVFILPMLIPHRQLTPAVLRAVVEEFVTRDGTDYSSVETRIDLVLRQLDAGTAELHFDDDTKTCQIVLAGGK